MKAQPAESAQLVSALDWVEERSTAAAGAGPRATGSAGGGDGRQANERL
jgi:hypothetical protein